MSEPIGIIGVGRVGLAAAKAWIDRGHEIFGYDTNPSALSDFVSAGGKALKSPGEVARHARLIILLVLNGDQVVDVITGKDGVLRAAREGTTVICMSTIHQETLQFISERCDEKNIGLVDCPFTGGVARIPSGSLTLIAAAPEKLLSKVTPVLEVIGRIVYAGEEPGLGQAVKVCNQLLVGVTQAATMEVITLARKLGLDPALVTTVAGSGIAGSDYFRLLSDSVLKNLPSPGGLGQMCKDMGIVRDALRKAGLQAKVASAAAAYFATAEQLGMGQRESADLIEVVEQATTNNEQTESI